MPTITPSPEDRVQNPDQYNPFWRNVYLDEGDIDFRSDDWDYQECITGNSLGNKIWGLSGGDTILGMAGNDTLYGGEGSDHLDGGIDDDVLIGGEGGDYLYGGWGNDTASYEDSNAAVTVDLTRKSHRLELGESETVSDGIGGDAQGDRYFSIENITGSVHDDTIQGNSEDNVLKGGAGKDDLDGGKGNDTLEGGQGDDTLEGGAGNDLLIGGRGYDDGTPPSSENPGNDIIHGGSGDDIIYGDGPLYGGGLGGANRLYGDGGDDQLFGGNGTDLLDGGEGNDKLQGGFGDDLFEFSGEFGHDTIFDFGHANSGNDTIKIDTPDDLTIEQFKQLLVQDGRNVKFQLDQDNSITLISASLEDVRNGVSVSTDPSFDFVIA